MSIASIQLLSGLRTRGHGIRALVPITVAEQASDSFAKAHPELRVSRFLLPYVEPNPRNPASPDHLTVQTERLLQSAAMLIEEERPDLILVGTEQVIHQVPDLASSYGLPCIAIAHGVIDPAIGGTYRQDLVDRMVAAFREAALTIVVAHFHADGLKRLGVERVATVPNGVDLDQFRPGEPDEALRRALSIDPDDVVAMHISTLREVKRPLDLVRSAALALKREERLCYVVIGDGPHRVEMEEICREAGIADRFRFAGIVAHADMPAYLKLADLVLQPSETECQSMVFLEAQAAGRVLLVSDIPGSRELIRDGETGFVFEKGNVEALAEKTVTLAARAELRQAVGRRARDQAEAHYDVEKNIAAYERLFLQVAAAHRSRALRRGA